MKERFIVAPGCNGTELLRTLARFGVNTMGLRIVSAVELAKTALIRSGVSVSAQFLSRKEEPALIDSFFREIPYFSSASYADAEKLSAAMYSMRSLVTGKEEKEEIEKALADGEFPEKNEAVLQAFFRFLEKCRENRMIDSISLIRLAMEKADVRLDIKTLAPFKCSPLEKALAEALSGGQEECELSELFACENRKTTGKSREKTYTEAYGAVNEAEDIIHRIYSDQLPLDECVIAYAGSTQYAQLFYDLSKTYGIPMTFGMGVPIVNSYPAQFLKLLSSWNREGYHGIDALKALVFSPAFDRKHLAEVLQEEKPGRDELKRFAEICGGLRLSFDEAENGKRIEGLRSAFSKGISFLKEEESKYLDWAEKFSGELGKGCIRFFRDYAVIRDGAEGLMDQSAIQVITEGLSSYARFSGPENAMDIVPDLLNKTVRSEMRKDGYLHVTSIAGAFSSVRKNLFLCGLSAAEFPGTPSENYLLLDNDLLSFRKDDSIPTSENRINEKKRMFHALVSFGEKLGAQMYLSYSDYDLAELKDRNPSSVLYQVYRKDHPDAGMEEYRRVFRKAEYFMCGLSRSEKIGASYSKGAEFAAEPQDTKAEPGSGLLARSWSPSALDAYFRCPRYFYLTRVCGIEEEESDDPFAVWSAAEAGTAAHKAMEMLGEKRMPQDEFLQLCGEYYDGFLAGRPPVHESDADRERKEFLEMMEKAYRQDPRGKVKMAETDVRGVHPTGVGLHGFPDRIEETKDGETVIVDFKTGRRINHVEDDADTCLQALVYAWLTEQRGEKVDWCEYRYLRREKTVRCAFDEEMKARLEEKLLLFKEALETNCFPRAESTDNCRYCRLGAICHLPEDDGKEETEND